MMRQFVHKNVADQRAKRHAVATGPFIEDRAPEQPDRIRPPRLVHDRLFRHRDTVIKTGQLERIVDFQFVKDVVGREVLDPNQHLHRRVAEGVGQEQHRLFGHLFEFGKAGGGYGCPVHACVTVRFGHRHLHACTHMARNASPGKGWQRGRLRGRELDNRHAL